MTVTFEVLDKKSVRQREVVIGKISLYANEHEHESIDAVQCHRKKPVTIEYIDKFNELAMATKQTNNKRNERKKM